MATTAVQHPASNPTPEELVADLVLLLDLNPRDQDRFVGRRKKGGIGRVFGGQVIAQALGAAERTVSEDRHAHSLHAYFLRPGHEEGEVHFRVRRDFDGASYSNRRVVAMQDGNAILNLTASFQREREGLDHQHPAMPDVPPSQDIVSDNILRREFGQKIGGELGAQIARPWPIDTRSIEPRAWIDRTPREPVAHCWLRAVAPLPDDPRVHRAVLAYASDLQLLSTAMLPHGVTWHRGEVKAASLDHAIWFHEPFRADDWLLYVTDSPWAGHARGFNRGQIFSGDGRLVASVAQEGLIRPTHCQD